MCLPQHWALAKIKTYSLQTTPFLHVDGDIYVPRPLPEDVLSAPLIAQNREIGTAYYKHMLDKILSYPEILIPDFIQKGLNENSIASYNMGFLGTITLHNIFGNTFVIEKDTYNFEMHKDWENEKWRNIFTICGLIVSEGICVKTDADIGKIGGTAGIAVAIATGALRRHVLGETSFDILFDGTLIIPHGNE